MIEWKKFDSKTAPDEIEENYYLLVTSERIVSAEHDAINHWFTYHMGDCMHIIPYDQINHYAEINWPDTDEPMITWCEHGKILVCEECAKRHRPTT
jgi:hypothetical protein